MTVIGQGVIEVSADASKLKAGIADAKRSIKSLGTATTDANTKSTASIDRYVKRLELQAATLGRSTRETELYKLALRGASKDQLMAADSALKMADAFAKGERIGAQIRAGFLLAGAAAATGFIAAAVAFDQLVKKAGDFQDMAEKIGDTGQNIASLAIAAGTAGTSMDTVVSASQRLTKGLTGVDDESKAAGAAIGALGLDLKNFKALAPADQFEAVAKSLAGFEDGAQKTAVAMALFGKSGAELLPFLKELGAEGGRQVILTQKQIEQADAYSDAQAKLRAEISLHAQAIATEMLPVVTELTSLISDLAKDQDFAATASDILKAALGGAINVFQAVAVVAANVGFVFKGVGREIGAVAAQLAALARLDFAGFTAISDAVKEDGVRARAELDKFQEKILSIGNAAAKFKDPRLLGDPGSIAEQTRGFGRKKLSFSGAEKKAGKGADTAAQEAKAQLAYDIAQIKQASDAYINTIANAQKIVEAKRAAGLLDEGDYYAARLGFLNLNNAAQEDALKKEIARLQAQKLSGKDKIDNDRKIADSEAKLAKVREDSVTSLQLLGIQEASAASKLQQYYRDAEDAASDYLDTLRRAQAAELSGFGAGRQERDRLAGRAQIEDKYTSQRRDLDKSRRDSEFSGTFGSDEQKKYDDEIDRIRRFQATALGEYDAYFAKRLAQEGNWANGASEALQNYIDNSRDIAAQTEELFTNAFKGMEDALVSFVTTGKLDFKSLANSIIADITRIIIKQQIAAAAKSLFGDSGGGSSGGFITSLLGGLFGGGRAIGGPVSAGGMYRVNEKGPELLNVAGKQYLMMGNQGGTVTPTGGDGGGSTVVQVNVTAPQGGSRATALQWGADAGRQIQRALDRNN